jgi:hypothetical protein
VTRVVCIHGTWGADFDHAGHQWYEPCSPFVAYLKTQAIDASTLAGFLWSGDIGGIAKVLPWNWFRSIDERDWRAGAESLTYFLRPSFLRNDEDAYVPLTDRNIIAHSHALQVVTYACANGLKINKLLTIGSPVRADMNDLYRAARPNIGVWTHVHSDGGDKMQWLGELFDGHLGIVREQPFADRNLRIPRVSHSKLLNDPAAFPCWQQYGLLEFLKAAR